MQLRPVEKQTLARTVMERLLEYIEGGTVRPGEALPSQHDLARQLAVSRPVLREAMQGLAAVGVVEIRPGSGCYVRDPQGDGDSETAFETFTHEGALDVLEARMVIEVELAALAAERATAADFDVMDSMLVRLQRASRRNQPTARITSDFHQALIRAGHNTALSKMAQLLTRPRLVQGLRVEHTLPDITGHEYASHQRLSDAIRSGDPLIARAAMREHLEIAHGWEDQIAALRSRLSSHHTG